MKRPWWQSVLFFVLGLLALAAAWQGVQRLDARAAAQLAAAKPADVDGIPAVATDLADASPATRVVHLIGEARPWLTTTVYAKVSGYLHEIRVDRGSRVVAGDIIAVLDVPELDQQLKAAKADAQNRTSLANRAQKLAAPGVVSAQEADTAKSAAAVADAQVATLASQRDYRNVRAPFDGVVTARYADPGALLQAATSAQTSALPVVRVSDVDKLRVSVYLSQDDAAAVHLGDDVTVSAPNHPESAVKAQISRLSGELDARSRSLLAEIDVDNRDGRFSAGAFLDVAWTVHQKPQTQVPAAALLVRGPQTFVAVIGAEARVALRPVRVLDHDGARARILGEVKPGDRVALSGGDELVDGLKVRPVAQPAKDGKK